MNIERIQFRNFKFEYLNLTDSELIVNDSELNSDEAYRDMPRQTSRHFFTALCYMYATSSSSWQ